MTFGDFSKIFTRKLAGLYAPNETQAMLQLLGEKLLQLSYAQVSTAGKMTLSEGQQQQAEKWMEEMLTGKPLQYVLGEAWFLDRKFMVNSSVLIPRNETEELVVKAIDFLKNVGETNQKKQVLDVGTGSGCIAISLSLAIKNTDVMAIDLSEHALFIASENNHGLRGQVSFKKIDFLDIGARSALGQFDLIVSNPPYIPASESVNLAPHVRDWEPGIALFVPENQALLFYENLAVFGNTHLQKKGCMLMECHQDFAEEVKNLFISYGFQAKLYKDMHGNNRMVEVSR